MAHQTLDRPQTASAWRSVRQLLSAFLVLSVLTVVAAVVLRHHTAMVTSGVWTRSIIVVASAVLSLSFSVRASRGSARAFLRLRLVSAATLVAIAVIIAIPGSFPGWFKVEQGACGILLLGVVALVNGSRLRSAFAGR